MIKRRKKITNSSGKIKHKNKIIDGIKFDSIAESEFYVFLKDLKNKNKIKDFSLQPKFLLQDKFIIADHEVIYGNDKRFNILKKKHNAQTIRAIHYISDFKIELNDNNIVIVDVKGIKTADFKIKEKLVQAKYPELTFLCVQKYENEWQEYSVVEKKKKEKRKKK